MVIQSTKKSKFKGMDLPFIGQGERESIIVRGRGV